MVLEGYSANLVACSFHLEPTAVRPVGLSSLDMSVTSPSVTLLILLDTVDIHT